MKQVEVVVRKYRNALPFPCSPVTRECSWKKTQIEKKTAISFQAEKNNCFCQKISISSTVTTFVIMIIKSTIWNTKNNQFAIPVGGVVVIIIIKSATWNRKNNQFAIPMGGVADRHGWCGSWKVIKMLALVFFLYIFL